MMGAANSLVFNVLAMWSIMAIISSDPMARKFAVAVTTTKALQHAKSNYGANGGGPLPNGLAEASALSMAARATGGASRYSRPTYYRPTPPAGMNILSSVMGADPGIGVGVGVAKGAVPAAHNDGLFRAHTTSEYPASTFSAPTFPAAIHPDSDFVPTRLTAAGRHYKTLATSKQQANSDSNIASGRSNYRGYNRNTMVADGEMQRDDYASRRPITANAGINTYDDAGLYSYLQLPTDDNASDANIAFRDVGFSSAGGYYESSYGDNFVPAPTMQAHSLRNFEQFSDYDEQGAEMADPESYMLSGFQDSGMKQAPVEPKHGAHELGAEGLDLEAQLKEFNFVNEEREQFGRSLAEYRNIPVPGANPIPSVSGVLPPYRAPLTNGDNDFTLSKHIEVLKHVPVTYQHKQFVPYDKPVAINVPRAILKTVRRPLPIEVPVSETIAVPKLQDLKVPVEKVKTVKVDRPVPMLVERRVPYAVEKPVVTPYYYPYPVRVPIVRTIVHKLNKPSLYRHKSPTRYAPYQSGLYEANNFL